MIFAQEEKPNEIRRHVIANNILELFVFIYPYHFSFPQQI
jgi:hypothetical protein